MKRIKVRITKSFIILVIFVGIISSMILMLWSGIIDIGGVFEWVRWFIFSAFLIMIFAILGALFVGLLLGHRLLSVGGFTPFEESMLEMKDDIEKIYKKLESIEQKLDRK